MEALLTRIKAIPVVGPVVSWAEQHPRLAAWIVLAVGMVIILAVEARDVGLEIGQWLALVVATVLVAGLCIWIVSWEDSGDAEAPAEGAAGAEAPETPPAEDDEPVGGEPAEKTG